MSTKIYNAYKLPKMQLDDFFAMIELLKKEVYKAQKKVCYQKFISKCLKMYDHKTIYPNSSVVFEKTYRSNGSKVQAISLISEWLEANELFKQSSDKITDLYFHVNFIFHKGMIYAITHEFPNSSYHKILKKVSKGKLYEYYNNTDGPKSMTTKAWRARGNEWNEVLGNSGNNDKSVKVICRLEVGLENFKEEKLNKMLTSKLQDSKRLERFAENIALQKLPPPNTNSTVDILQHMRSDNVIKQREEEKTELKKLVSYNLTVEDLFNQEYTIKRMGSDWVMNDYSIDVERF
jgi:hypothetical protein